MICDESDNVDNTEIFGIHSSSSDPESEDDHSKT